MLLRESGAQADVHLTLYVKNSIKMLQFHVKYRQKDDNTIRSKWRDVLSIRFPLTMDKTYIQR